MKADIGKNDDAIGGDDGKKIFGGANEKELFPVAVVCGKIMQSAVSRYA